MKNQPSPYRLPVNVIPGRYDIFLAPDLEAGTFFGHEAITVRVVEATSEIWLNAVELEIIMASIFDLDRSRLLQGIVSLDEKNERCCITFSEPVTPGAWKLVISFKGVLNDKLRGFYRSTYKDQAGATHVMTATQCEATDARRIFPCWDEPAFKAVLSLTVAIDPGLTAVSNTAVISENLLEGKKVVLFGETIKMSTYLFALVVGELEAMEPLMVGRTPLRVWCMQGKKGLTAFARVFGADVLEFFEGYYGVPYPGDKLDLLAIPDFASGAMENLGAITFRETALLVDEAEATHAEIARVADVVAHEEAHMWFGDLVTMLWWNGIWLNEAFATFMEMLAVDYLKPEWRRWEGFGISRAAAFAVDGLHSTRPIEFPVTSPKEADAMFDILTYEKGASVLRMLEQHLSPDVFRDGVRRYIRDHPYSNTETVDLWNALGDVAGMDVATLMNNWIFKPGYPVVSARLEDGQLVLRQQRFTYLPRPLENVPGRSAKAAVLPQNQMWQIPVQIRMLRDGKRIVKRVLLTECEMRMAIPDGADAIIVNEGGNGFYRVSYGHELLDLLQDHLGLLSPVERFNLVGDAWAAVRAGLMPIDEYLDFVMRFCHERSRSVWSVIINSLVQIRRVVEDADLPEFELVVQNRLRKAADYLGWEPQPSEDDLTGQLRGEILLALGTLGNDRQVQERAEKIYRAYQAGTTTVDPNVLKAIIHILAGAGDAVRYEEFLAAFRTAKTPQGEQRFLYALVLFQDPELVELTLAKTINGEIRTQDASYVLRSMLLSMHSRERTWDFMRAKWDTMERQYPQKSLKRTMEGLAGLATPGLERSVWEFLAEKNVDFGGRVLEQQLEELRIMVAMREREGERLNAYLNR